MSIEDIDKKYVLQTYARNYTNFSHGENATLFDDKNDDYIDFTSGIGVVSVGHGNKKIANAIFEQISKITHVSNLYSIEPQALLAKKISDLSKYDMATFFSNSGAEANECAIKIARKYGSTKLNKQKYKIITLDQSFHGRTVTTLKATGQKSMHLDDFAPYPDGFESAKDIKDIYAKIDNETVAIMLELVQGEGGVYPLDKKEIQDLEKYLRQKEILLVVDEVQTGIYRTGEFLASNIYGICPDIITIAKGLGGGVPIGATMTKHKDIFNHGDHGSTFGGNYLSTTAALNVCNILEELKYKNTLEETIDYFGIKLQELFENNKKLFTKCVGIGLMRGLRVKDIDILTEILRKTFEKKVLVLKSGRNTLRFLPPLTISKDEINEGFKRIEDAICHI